MTTVLDEGRKCCNVSTDGEYDRIKDWLVNVRKEKDRGFHFGTGRPESMFGTRLTLCSIEYKTKLWEGFFFRKNF